MRVRLMKLLLLAAASLLSQATANADIIRCNDANGNALYTDSAYTAERHKREIEDRWLDEGLYEAESRSVEARQAPSDEGLYAAYWFVGAAWRCGAHCIAFPRHRHVALSRIGHGNRHMKNPDERRDLRAAGNEPRHLLRSTAIGNRTVQSGGLAINMKSGHPSYRDR